MQVGMIWGLEDHFGIDFEKYIAEQLEKLGFKCFTSVYTRNLDVESQIDVVALCRYSIVCIECKSWNCVDLDWDRCKLNWKYTTVLGNLKQARNPLRQCMNQTETLRRDLEENMDIKSGYPCYSVVVIKGNGNESKARKSATSSNNIYMCNDLEMLRDRYLLEPNVEFDKETISKYSEFFLYRQDMSSKRLEEHRNYINNCKETKTGLWRQHTGIELYQI